MTVIKIILFLLGIAFLMFGFLIYFRRKFHLINGFEEDFKNGRKTEAYARRVGLVEFIVGVALLGTVVLLIVFG